MRGRAGRGSLLIILTIAAALIALGRSRGEKISIFSWHAKTVNEEEMESLFRVMERLGASRVYQNFDIDQPSCEREKFWQTAKDKEYEVYYLCGDPKWSFASRHHRIAEAVWEAESLRKESFGTLKGIVFDVEPYVLEEWKRGADELMDSYTASMEYACQSASAYGLEVILCIPNFYDNHYEKELEFLIRDCCDAVAVMNYTKRDPQEKIRQEAALAQEYGKKLIHISEVKEGDDGWVCGQVEEIRAAWKRILAEYPELELEFSYCYLDPLMEAYGRE